MKDYYENRGLTRLACCLLTLILGAGVAAAAGPDTPTAIPSTGKAVNLDRVINQRPRPTRISTKKPVRKANRKKARIGSASWYGQDFQGRPTASGEAYDMYQFTAASRELPLGSWVKVTNLRNGKWLIVKVNDRGPYVGNRIMDVSYGAAQMLDFKSRGIEKVKLEVVEPEMMANAATTWPLD